MATQIEEVEMKKEPCASYSQDIDYAEQRNSTVQIITPAKLLFIAKGERRFPYKHRLKEFIIA